MSTGFVGSARCESSHGIFMNVWALQWLWMLYLLGALACARAEGSQEQVRASSLFQPDRRQAVSTLPTYAWQEFKPLLSKDIGVTSVAYTLETWTTSRPASAEVGGIPVYVSITTISSRIHEVAQTISEMLMGTLTPTRVYLFVSKEGYLLDKGIPQDQIPDSLKALVETQSLTIVYVDNLGPHRKLLPLLANKWHEDCIIVTVDDEPKAGGMGEILQQLIRYHKASGCSSVVALRAKRIGVCEEHPYTHLKYSKWGVAEPDVTQRLVLPTGTGGVLYRPAFFHPIVFDPKLLNLTATADDLMFRVATLANDVQVTVGCRLRGGKGEKQICPENLEIASTDSMRILPCVNCTDPDAYRRESGAARKLAATQVPVFSEQLKNGTTSVRRNPFKTGKLSAVGATKAPTGDSHVVAQGASVVGKKKKKKKNKESLLHSFNRYGLNDNTNMFRRALDYMKAVGALDWANFVSTNLRQERWKCFYDLQKEDEDTYRIVGYIGDSDRPFNQCNVRTCSAPEYSD